MATLNAKSTVNVTCFYYEWNGATVGQVYTAGSQYLGGEGNRIRVMGFKFTSPKTGIVQLSFKLTASSWTTGYTSHTPQLAAENLAFQISETLEPPKPSDLSLGTITATETQLSSDKIKIILKPNTDYYLWIYSTKYYQGYWKIGSNDAIITYDGGAVTLFIGSTPKKAIFWVHHDGAWKNAIPWMYNTKWKNTC